VDAREAVLGDAPVARALVVPRLERLERRPVLDAQPAQVAEPDRLAGALQAAGRLGDRLLERVWQLVLDVAVVPFLGLERVHPIARRLQLARERHDREELGLWLGEGLAGADRVEIEALEERVDRVRGATPLRDGLDDGRRPDPDVAGPEHAGPSGRERHGVGLEPRVLRLVRSLVARRAEPVELGPL